MARATASWDSRSKALSSGGHEKDRDLARAIVQLRAVADGGAELLQGATDGGRQEQGVERPPQGAVRSGQREVLRTLARRPPVMAA